MSLTFIFKMGSTNNYSKIGLAMRLTGFFLLVCLMQTSAATFGQTVTLHKKDASLKEILKDVRAQTGFNFIYSNRTIRDIPTLTISGTNMDLKEVLEKALLEQGLTYSINKKVIVLKKEERPLPAKEEEIASEPERQITGTVVDSTSGEPLAGVTIRVQGTNNGTVTDGEGKFTLTADDNAVLEVSFVGYSGKTVSLKGGTTIHILLSSTATGLDQLVVVGYGVQKKSDLTGSIDVVKVSELKQQPEASAIAALQGKASGVQIINDGAPGSTPQIRIRGYSTINNNDPLYIIDGVPFTGNISWLNSEDIQSMQVLKDASAASIYGSRANNGVVIITTKQGENGAPKISLNVYYGTQRPNRGRFPKFLNPMQYAEYVYERARNAGETPGTSATTGTNYGFNPDQPTLPEFLVAGSASGQNITPEDADPSKYSYTPNNQSTFYQITRANQTGTNWFDEITQNAPIQNYDLSITGGGNGAKYALSGNYFNQMGTFKYTKFERATIRSNSSYNFFNDRVTIGENLQYSYINGNGFGVNEDVSGSYIGEASPIGWAYRMQTIIPVYDIMGNFAGTKGDKLGNASNPLAVLYRQKDNYKKDNQFFGNAYLNINPLEGLNLKTSYGVQYTTSGVRTIGYSEPERSEASFNHNTLDESRGYVSNWTWSNTLNYQRVFNEIHNFNLLLGVEAVKNKSRTVTASGNGFFLIGQIPYYYVDAAENNSGGSFGLESSLYSLFGRLDYSFRSKYLASLTLRRDGSSNFSNRYHFGTFPAASVAWRLSEEEFIRNLNWINDLKLRAGYGETGNQNIPSLQYLKRFASSISNSFYPIGGGEALTSGIWASNYDNPDVKWETVKSINLGLDFTIFNNSIDGSVDWYNKKTSGMLFPVPQPASAVGIGSSPYINSGDMRNSGVELLINYHYNPGGEGFKMDIGGMISTNRNKVIKLAPTVTEQPYLEVRSVQPSILKAGEPLGSFYGFKVVGIYQDEEDLTNSPTYSGARVGGLKFADVSSPNGQADGVVDAYDRTIIGNPYPDFIYSLSLGGSFKSFDFSMFFNGSAGNDLFDLTREYTDFYGFPGAVSKRVLNAWSPQNPNSLIPSPSDAAATLEDRSSSYYVQNGSYLKMKNLQIGYTFSDLFNGNISRLRIYLGVTNLFVITSYSGMDPEVSQMSSDFTAPGVDLGVYPASRQYLFGINLDF